MTYRPPASLKVLKRIRVPYLSKRPPAIDVHKITPEDVRDFYIAMCGHYNVKLIDKNNSADMQMLADNLDRLGIVDHDRFLRDFVTTVGNKIYAPFTPGIAVGVWDLWQQTMVLGHEIQHVAQDRAKEGILFEFEYTSNSTKRAYYEMEAYRVQQTLAWHFRGEELSPRALAELLRDYNCDQADIDMVCKMLMISAKAIQKGAVPGAVCQFEVDWLEARWLR